MPPTVLPTIIKPQPYAVPSSPTTPPPPVQVLWTAADATNGNAFISTGRETLHAINTAAGTGTVTITSQPDPYNRTRTIGPITLATSGSAGSEVVFQKFPQLGWATGDLILVSASATTVQFYVAQDPL